MNEDTIAGHGNTLGGHAKETIGAATGDRSLQASGVIDQVKGAIQKTIGGASDGSVAGTRPGVAGTGQPDVVDKARQFARDRPWAAAALAGVVGMAVLNTLRGRR